MPEQLHPPYVKGATTIPRQLNRWLDVNAQNGPLRRTQTFITLPAFNINPSWNGYSEIVASFNFEAPNAFSLVSATGLPVTSPNYLLCISWTDSSGTMYRYSLWSGVGETLYFNVPEYTNQLIKNNFRLEVWSVNANNAIQATDINFFTSVLGSVDYRFGLDSELKVADAIVTDFNSPPPSNINMIPSGAVYVPVIDHFDYVLVGTIQVGANYMYTQGNSVALYADASPVTPDLQFAGTTKTYTLYGSAAVVVTALVTKLSSFAVPLTFPSGSISQSN